ncbi:MAG: hypothetical protein IJW59_05170 [Clostridia bacterium]|nr:hypothetical protein [Clostridia bacterium]
MKYKVLSRDILKLIALFTMLLDHIGKVFFPGIIILQIIGRFSFPIFAFFIAEGFYYTKDRFKYLLRLAIFALVSQIPYYFVFDGLNILYTFVLSVILLFIWDLFCTTKTTFLKIIFLIIFILTILILWPLSLFGISYRIYGILLPVIFYIFREKPILKYILFIMFTIGFVLETIFIAHSTSMDYLIQLFSILATAFLIFYNPKIHSNKIIKHIFYLSYPLHLIIIILIRILL